MLGRASLKLDYELIPHAVEGVPEGVEAVSVVWVKGARLCVTEPAPVNPYTRTATFREVMRQVRGGRRAAAACRAAREGGEAAAWPPGRQGMGAAGCAAAEAQLPVWGGPPRARERPRAARCAHATARSGLDAAAGHAGSATVVTDARPMPSRPKCAAPRQTATLQHTRDWLWHPKEARIKVQGVVRGALRRTKHRTVAHAVFDLADFAPLRGDGVARVDGVLLLDGAGPDCMLRMTVRSARAGTPMGPPGAPAPRPAPPPALNGWGSAGGAGDGEGGDEAGGLADNGGVGRRKSDEYGDYHSSTAFMDVFMGMGPTQRRAALGSAAGDDDSEAAAAGKEGGDMLAGWDAEVPAAGGGRPKSLASRQEWSLTADAAVDGGGGGGGGAMPVGRVHSAPPQVRGPLAGSFSRAANKLWSIGDAAEDAEVSEGGNEKPKAAAAAPAVHVAVEEYEGEGSESPSGPPPAAAGAAPSLTARAASVLLGLGSALGGGAKAADADGAKAAEDDGAWYEAPEQQEGQGEGGKPRGLLPELKVAPPPGAGGGDAWQAEDEDEAPTPKFSGPLPEWMWPQGRAEVRAANTQQLSRAITKAADTEALQTLARGLLAERNDWRSESMRWRGEARDALEAGAQARACAATLAERAAELEARANELEVQLAGARDESLLSHLVAAKMAAAAKEVEASELRSELEGEQERVRTLAARLAAAEARYESLLKRASAGGQPPPTPRTPRTSTAFAVPPPLPLPPLGKPVLRSVSGASGAGASGAGASPFRAGSIQSHGSDADADAAAYHQQQQQQQNGFASPRASQPSPSPSPSRQGSLPGAPPPLPAPPLLPLPLRPTPLPAAPQPRALGSPRGPLASPGADAAAISPRDGAPRRVGQLPADFWSTALVRHESEAEALLAKQRATAARDVRASRGGGASAGGGWFANGNGNGAAANGNGAGSASDGSGEGSDANGGGKANGGVHGYGSWAYERVASYLKSGRSATAANGAAANGVAANGAAANGVAANGAAARGDERDELL
jgi:hypothetical protein